MVEQYPIIVTSGEPAGIGPDIVLKYALESERKAPVVILGDPEVLAQRASLLNLKCQIDEIEFLQKLPQSTLGKLFVYPVRAVEPVIPGQLNVANASYVLTMIDMAIDACLRGDVQAMVTAPVHKKVINDAGISFTGHTEYLQARTQAAQVVMLLANGGLRVALVTVHIPLRKVPSSITIDGIVSVVQIVHAGLVRDFGIASPRIAVCGINPHAGEGGYLGDEEQRIISPALKQLKDQGINVDGPFPADTIFVPRHAEEFDVIVAMYHDQGLAAFKQASFGEGVNVTLGLPLIRVSVDHGTALSLAGTGNADAASLKSACDLANVLVRNRYAYLAATA